MRALLAGRLILDNAATFLRPLQLPPLASVTVARQRNSHYKTHPWHRKMSTHTLDRFGDTDHTYDEETLPDPNTESDDGDYNHSDTESSSPSASSSSEASAQSAPATLSEAREVLFGFDETHPSLRSLGQPYSLPEPHKWRDLSRAGWKNMLRRQSLSTLRPSSWHATNSSRPLLLTFDAFDTLFTPAEPIAKQYCDVSRHWGFEFQEDDVMKCFKTAFKDMNKRFPNYGKDTDMRPSTWWSQLIHNTLSPLLPAETPELPQDLPTALYNRFSSSEGYTLFPDVFPFLSLLGSSSYAAGIWPPTRTMLGIISNSDPRVHDILSSFGIPISPSLFPPRYTPHSRLTRRAPDFGPAHFAFATLSYNAGHSKPDRRIFDAAARDAQAALDTMHPVGRLSRTGGTLLRHVHRGFHHMHVGDDVEKDVLPALDCGWDAVLLDRQMAEPVATRKVGPDREVTVVNSLMALREVVTKERLEGQEPVWLDLEGKGPIVVREKNKVDKRGRKALLGRKLVDHPLAGRSLPLSTLK